MPRDPVMAADSATLLAPPESFERPPHTPRAVLDELVRQEGARSGPRATLASRVGLEDWRHVAEPSPPLDETPEATALAARAEQVEEIIANWRSAAAEARGAFVAPEATKARLDDLEARVVQRLLDHYAATRRAAAAFATQHAAPAPTPHDVVIMELAESIVRSALPDFSVAWFRARFEDGDSAWPLLRQVCRRLGERPPAHLAIQPFVRAFTELAARPFTDPILRAAEARAFAASVVDRVRSRIVAFGAEATQARR